MSHKPTAAEYRKRVNHVAAMLATGSARADIMQYGAEKWDLSIRAVDNLIARATVEIREAADSTKTDDEANARAIYMMVLREQIGRRDFRGAVATNDKLCRLLGLNAPERTEHTGADGAPLVPTTQADLAARFEELVREQAARLRKKDQ